MVEPTSFGVLLDVSPESMSASQDAAVRKRLIDEMPSDWQRGDRVVIARVLSTAREPMKVLHDRIDEVGAPTDCNPFWCSRTYRENERKPFLADYASAIESGLERRTAGSGSPLVEAVAAFSNGIFKPDAQFKKRKILIVTDNLARSERVTVFPPASRQPDRQKRPVPALVFGDGARKYLEA